MPVRSRKQFILKRLVPALLILLCIGIVYFISAIYVAPPEVNEVSGGQLTRTEPSPGLYKVGKSWLKRSRPGLYELYVEGDGFERGVANGLLTKELAEFQESVFISQIRQLIPSEGYLNFLKYFVAYFNRNITDHIIPEYQEEIYGVSLSASDKYDHLAPKYYRILNYHSAHDIGHALQDKNMTVGCTSFGALKNKTSDGSLLIGRNFDFFAGEDFAKNTIVCFTRPAAGNKFMYVTWAGFTGVVSGMNDKGLTVTINASKSDIPSSAATPISLLAKEILQYASSISEAWVIAQKRETFVSESIFIGSASDTSCAIIEKSPVKEGLLLLEGNEMICSNHFRGAVFEKDHINHRNILESSSLYRYFRMKELLAKDQEIDPPGAAAILRNTKGLGGRDIGLTNEKSINQLIAHHSVIFKPEQRLVWVSTAPYQLGEYVCYDLDKVFDLAPQLQDARDLTENEKTIPADPILKSKKYEDFLMFRQLKTYIIHSTRYKLTADKLYLKAFESSNPESYFTHWILGDYHLAVNDTSEARTAYQTALEKEVATIPEKNKITDQLNKLRKK